MSQNDESVAQAWSDFRKSLKRWRQALAAATQAADQHRAAAARLAKTDSRLGVHLFHRDIIIEESGVTQLRGTFQLSRRVLVFGAVLTALGATLYALGLPGPDSKPDTLSFVQFTPGVPTPNEGTGLVIRIYGLAGDRAETCGFPVRLDGVLVGDAGAVSEVIVGEGENRRCRGRWLLPVGTWYEVSGQTLPLDNDTSGDDTDAGDEPADDATTGTGS